VNAQELRQLSEELALGPVPGRHVCLWQDDADLLMSILHKGLTEYLDIARLMPSEEPPPGAEREAAKRIERALRTKLKELASQLAQENRRQILVVAGTELLARYGVGIGAFYDEYVSDKTMVVLTTRRVVADSPVLDTLPDFVILDPDAAYRYIRRLLESDEAVVTSQEE